jgi:CRISPR-associated DxTHG motif protein
MKTVLIDIWHSFRSMPLWVQIWVGGILVPVNLATIVLITEPCCWLIPVLAIGGMVPNAVLMFVERGFSKAMALSHVLLWVPLLFLLGYKITTGWIFTDYLIVLFIVNFISLCFDVKDSRDWLKGDRKIAS